ncbi:MAG: glycosyltransferase, partial [Actinomycetota bacterium]|nr:glycosyltransferase [Actinomycetota bacterium]
HQDEKIAHQDEKIAHQDEKIAHQDEKIAHQDEKIAHQDEKIAGRDAKIRNLKGRSVEREQHIAGQAKKIADIERRLSSSASRVRAQQQRIGRLEDDRAKLRDRLALARWKLTSTTSRKWWRIGVAIGQVKSNVFRIFVLPFDIVSIMFSHSNLPPRPQPTRVKKSAGAKGASPRVGITDSAAKAAQGSTAKHRDSKLLPMIVAAPVSMSLAAPPVTNIRGLRVASILDEMSHQSFAPECGLVTFGPHNWLEVLERERPNILLVESAWRGNSGSWEYKVGTYAYPESVGLPDLTALVEWCRSEGVPTVFWNKEDPIHFDKFKEAAALFDVVFTTDANMTDQYQDLPGVTDRVVGVLPFAAQPIIHNPVGSMTGRDPRPVFAGAYYRNRHHSRRSQLDMLLDAALPFDLMIYDRMGGAVSESFGFPERFQPNIEGTLPYEEMVQAYRSHRLFLNVNSVSDSPTMFSRRVFELLASGTPVVSTSSIGVEQMFGGVVDIVETQSQANEAITRLIEDDEWWLDRSVRGIESVFQANTYADRLHTIAEAAGLSVGSARPRVSVVIGPGSDLSVEDFAGIGNVAEILSLTDQGSGSNTGGVLPVRQIEAPSDGDASSIGHAVSRAASGDWLAFANSAADLWALRSLTTATRITPAEIYVPASNWAQGHEFVNEFDAVGLSVASRDFVDRTSWSPWHSSSGSTAGARVYSAPIIDD